MLLPPFVAWPETTPENNFHLVCLRLLLSISPPRVGLHKEEEEAPLPRDGHPRRVSENEDLRQGNTKSGGKCEEPSG